MSSVPQKPKPSGVTYLIPVAVWILFSIAAVVIAVMGVMRAGDVVDNFARIDDATTATVELKSEGGYRVWLERPDISGGTFGPDATVTVTQDGEDVAVSPYSGSLDYSDGDSDITALYTFDAPAAGEYEITATADDGQGGTFLVGKDNPVSEAGKGIGIMVLVGSVGFLIALILFIVIAVKRGKSKRQIRQAATAYPPQGYGGPQGYGQPQGYGAPQGYGQPGPGQAAPPPGYGTPPAPSFGSPPPPRQGGTPPPPPFGGGAPPPPT